MPALRFRHELTEIVRRVQGTAQPAHGPDGESAPSVVYD